MPTWCRGDPQPPSPWGCPGNGPGARVAPQEAAWPSQCHFHPRDWVILSWRVTFSICFGASWGQEMPKAATPGEGWGRGESGGSDGDRGALSFLTDSPSSTFRDGLKSKQTLSVSKMSNQASPYFADRSWVTFQLLLRVDREILSPVKGKLAAGVPKVPRGSTEMKVNR